MGSDKVKSKIEDLLVKRPSYNMMVDSGILKVPPSLPLYGFLLIFFFFEGMGQQRKVIGEPPGRRIPGRPRGKVTTRAVLQR